MRINWLSNAPWARTGYGNQTLLFAPRIRELGHDVAMTAFYGLEGSVLDWNGMRVYPRGYDAYGGDVMGAHSAHFEADVLISLIDAWVVEPSMAPRTRWIPWFPIDHEPLPRAVAGKVSRAWRRIVFSKFGERMMLDAGLSCDYVPHGVDTAQFKPMSDRQAVRAELGWPLDKFVVGMVAANKGNPSRKSLTQNIAAFAALREKRDDVMLYLHTTAGEQQAGINLPEYLNALDLKFGYMGQCNANDVDVLFCDQYTSLIGFSEAYMAAVYNAMDVHLLVSMGEGFGIPILEAQACGCPVIVGDWTSMSELCFSGYTVAKSDAVRYWTPLAAWQWIAREPAITERLVDMYEQRSNINMRTAARVAAMAYDADAVTEKYWKPLLDCYQGELAAEPKIVDFDQVVRA
jgi:glycosyltransferase involved in cell wall biosynthesis